MRWAVQLKGHRNVLSSSYAQRMDHTLHRSSRPLAVKLALILLLINLGTAFIQQAIGADWRIADWSNPLVYVKWGSELLMMAIPLWFIYRGKNWARWLLVVVACAGLCISIPQFIQDFRVHSFPWLLDCLHRNLISAVALIALFLPSSSQWFRGRATVMQA